jgi:hypothetical protein
MDTEHSTVELGVVTIHGGAFTRTLNADVGSQSADTIKLGFSAPSFGSEGQQKTPGVNRRAVSTEPEPAPLVGRYRLSRLEWAARRCRLRFLIDRRRRFMSSAWRKAMANVMFNGILDSLTKVPPIARR